jgi:hypothetical protein
MANLLYPKAKEALLSGEIDLTTATVRAILVDGADYTYDAAHEFLDDVPSGARAGNSGGTARGDGVALGSKTVTDGVFDAADATLTAVTGDVSEFVLLYIDDGSADATSRLLALIDTATGLAITPSGGNIVITWHADGIFEL